MPDPQQQPRDPEGASAVPRRAHVLPAPFWCSAPRRSAGAAWLTVGGELDIAVAHRLEQALGRALDAFHLVVVDLEALGFIDLAGVRILVDASVQAACDGRRLLLASPPGHVRDLIAISGADDALEVLDLRVPADPRLPGLPAGT